MRLASALRQLARWCAVLSFVWATFTFSPFPFRPAAAASLNAPSSGALRNQSDTCALLSEAEITERAGGAVAAGEGFGFESCRWSNDQPPITSLLLIVHPPGSLREQILCGDLRQGGGEGERLGLPEAEVALWRFSNVISLFNSGELETCGPKGYVALTLNAERDEATLKEATLALFGTVVSRV